jgi:predicted porin
MKKILTAMLALAASASFAQVSLFGNIDQAYVRMEQNNSLMSTTSSNANTTSVWGIRGGEDLGNGLRANFELRSEIRLNTGQTGSALSGLAGTNTNNPTLFNRGAYVELQDRKMGTVRVGRQADAWWEATNELNNTGGMASFGFGNAISVGAATTTLTNISGGAPAGLAHFGTTTQNPTNVGAGISFFGGASYISPTISNVTVRVQTGAGKTTYADDGDIGGGAGYSVKYDNNTLKLILGSTWKNDTAGNKAWTNTTYGATYKLGKARLIYGKNKTDFAGLAAANNNLEVDSYGVGYDINSKTDIAVGYTVLKDVENTANKFTQTAVTARYKLSPRTTVYGAIGQGDNSGASKLNVIFGQAAGTAGKDVQAMMVGLRHTF